MDAISVDRLVAQACETTGLEDFGEDSWRDGLVRLVDARCGEARLNEIGVHVANADIGTYLTNRLCITDWQRREPAMRERDVTPPIVIVGQARTGTTILHDLLAQDPVTRVPLTWEVDRPCPPPETASYHSDPRIEEVQATTDAAELVIPGFKSMHPMGAMLAQECVRMTGADFRSMIFLTQYRVPSYARWLLDEADMAPTYRWHRRYLQHLQYRHPATRWVLKSPGHLWCLGALLAEYPDALLVQTHRDPLQIIASVGSLIATLRRMASDARPITEAAGEFAEYIIDGLDRSVAAREDGTVRSDRVVDVQFAAFMADPFATIRDIYARLGLELSNESEQRMRDFLAAHSREKRGLHEYTFADTELDVGELRERARRYTEYFDVGEEATD
jgi:hypothetical protein